MKINGRRIWQVACGDGRRNFADLLLHWGVLAVGPGGDAPWPDCADSLAQAGWGAKKLAIVRSFCQEISEGDLVVLRQGTRTIRAVGTIVGDYLWHPAFGDVDGWDLKHLRRVQWHWKGEQVFPVHTLKFGATVQFLDGRVLENSVVRDWLDDLPEPEAAADLPELPAPEPLAEEPTFEAVADYLFDHGAASGSVKSLVDQSGDLVRLARWYQRMKTPPSEHETVAYLVVPLLHALGWTPQTAAVEWNCVDIALFGHIPRENTSLVAVVEAKKRGGACLGASGQAFEYAEKHGKELLDRVIVTDGIRYGVYPWDPIERTVPPWPEAYFNLTSLRWNYPIYGGAGVCSGVGEGLRMMATDYRRPGR
jgi:hypothetical protein